MTGLDEAAPLDDGEFDGARRGEGLRHGTQPTAGLRSGTDVMTDCCACSVSIAIPSGPGGPGTAAPARRGYRDYDRAVTIEIDGKPTLLASADKPFRGDPGRWNPEDLLLAALSECHLLSYLHACVQAGVVVVGYPDEASGVMVEDGNGRRRVPRGRCCGRA